MAAVLIFMLFCLLLAGLRQLRNHASATPETVRKTLHLAAGTTAFTFPWLFDHALPVALLVCAIATLMLIRRRYSTSLQVARAGFGEIWMPLSIGLLFALTRGQPSSLYALPLSFLVYADSAAALVGTRFGRHPYASKTLEGTTTFFAIAFAASLIVLPLAPAVLLATAATALEHVSWQGLDNVSVPMGSYLVLLFLLSAPGMPS